MKHHDAVLLIWNKYLSGFSVSGGITSGVEHQLCVRVPGVSAMAGERENAKESSTF